MSDELTLIVTDDTSTPQVEGEKGWGQAVQRRLVGFTNDNVYILDTGNYRVQVFKVSFTD
jgi:hypothetical protein